MADARMIISEQLLLDCLHLPAGTEIKNVATTHALGYCDVELTVSHPDLHAGADSPPLITPIFRRQDPVVFIDWGQT